MTAPKLSSSDVATIVGAAAFALVGLHQAVAPRAHLAYMLVPDERVDKTVTGDVSRARAAEVMRWVGVTNMAVAALFLRSEVPQLGRGFHEVTLGVVFMVDGLWVKSRYAASKVINLNVAYIVGIAATLGGVGLVVSGLEKVHQHSAWRST